MALKFHSPHLATPLEDSDALLVILYLKNKNFFSANSSKVILVSCQPELNYKVTCEPGNAVHRLGRNSGIPLQDVRFHNPTQELEARGWAGVHFSDAHVGGFLNKLGVLLEGHRENRCCISKKLFTTLG